MRMWIYSFFACAIYLTLCVSADRYNYVFSCTPGHSRSSPDTSGCRVTITSGFYPATVNIYTATGTETLSLTPGQVVYKVYNETTLPSASGTPEPVGFNIGSDVVVLVVMEKTSRGDYENAYSDATEVYPIEDTDDRTWFRYYVVTFVPDKIICNTDNYKNFITITAYMDTSVNITFSSGDLVQLQMSEYETYSIADYGISPVVDYSGTVIRTYPAHVAVTGGSLCLFNPGFSFTNSAAFTQNPLIAPAYSGENFTTYIVPNLGNALRLGYDVRVLASDDGTTVNMRDSPQYVLQAGQYRDFTFPTKDSVTVITSNKPISALLLSLGNANRFGTFSTSVWPVGAYYSEVSFASLNTSTPTFLSVIAQGTGSFSDMELNGMSLGGEDWKNDDDSYDYSYMWMELPTAQNYILESVAGRRFVAYVYSHIGQRAGGYSYVAMGLTDLAPPTDKTTTESAKTSEEPDVTSEKPVVTTEKPVVTTEEPVVTTEEPVVTTEEPVVTTEEPVVTTEKPVVTTEEPVVTTEEPVVTTLAPTTTTTEEPHVDVLPLMNVRTNGNAESATTTESICAAQYSSAMRSKADSQAGSIDSKIRSDSLCAGRGDSIGHVTVSVNSKLEGGNRLVFEYVNVLEFGGENTPGDVVACATEVGEHLNSHANWAQPILPTPGGCDPVTFDPAEFPIEGNRWYCDVQAAGSEAFGGQTLDADNTLNILTYDVVISDVFPVVGADLTSSCADEYSREGAVRADAVRSTTNAWMNADEDTNCAGVATITKYSSLFFSLGNEAYYQLSYQFSWDAPETTTFNQFLQCMSTVTAYLRTHGAEGPWGDGTTPIPTPPGCSALSVTSDRFALDNRGWTCFDKA